MAVFGSTINPSLGRTDYSAIQQGANAAAQGILAGGQGIARGISQAGASIASGVEKHFKEQEQMKVMLGELDMIRKANPDAFKNVDPKIAERMAKGDIKFKEVAPLYAGVMTQQKLEQIQLQKKQQDFMNEIQKQEANARSLSALAAMRSAEASFAPKPTKPLRPMTLKEIADLGKQGVDVKAVPLEGGGWGAETISNFAPAASTNINMGGNAYDKTLGEAAANQHMAEYSAAKEAPANIAKLDEVADILKSGDVTTGVGAEIFQNVNRLRAQFLNDQKAGKSVSNTQILDSLLGSDVFPMIGALNIGARGMDTPAEREFLRQSFTGTKEMTPETLARLTEIRRNIQLRAIERFEKSNEAGTYKKFFEVTGNPQLDFSDIPPSGVSSAQWGVMSPEQRSLWKKPKK